jgi:hypothetical protein
MIDFEKYLIPAMEASNQTKNNQLPVEIKKIYEKMGAKPRTYIKDGRFLLHVGDLLEEGEAPNIDKLTKQEWIILNKYIYDLFGAPNEEYEEPVDVAFIKKYHPVTILRVGNGDELCVLNDGTFVEYWHDARPSYRIKDYCFNTIQELDKRWKFLRN